VGLYIQDSVIYATLHRFEEMGLVEALGNRYKLTDKGRHRLKFEAHTLKCLVGAIRL
jgi:DNA-binding PadR family transcriptional regulator